MKKFLSIFFVFALMLSFPIGIKAEVLEDGNGILYSVKNGEVTVEGFNYAGNKMKVPEKIDGLPVRYIAPYACRGNTAITTVILPSTIISVGDFAFAECPNLTKVEMKGGISIGRSAFRDCKALLKVTLPSTLESIDDFAFDSCVMLGKVKIPKGLKSIGVDAFAGCDRVRFEAGGNSYAKEYAESYSIPTSFKDSWEYTLLLIAVTTALLTGAVLAGKRIIKKAKENKTRADEA